MKKLSIVLLLIASIMRGVSDAQHKLIKYIESINQANDGKAEKSIIIESIKRFIEKGADVSKPFGDDNKTILMMAARLENAQEVIEFLVAQGANAKAQDVWGQTAIGHACTDDRYENIEPLINVGTPVRNQDLFSIFVFGEPRIVDSDLLKSLVRKCDDLHKRDYHGDSLLHRAVNCGVRSVRLLLDEGIDPHIKNTKNGQSALHSVCGYLIAHLEEHNWRNKLQERKEILGDLVTRGVQINVEDNHGSTPFHELVKLYRGEDTIEERDIEVQNEMFDFLLSLSADPFKKDHEGLSPLHYASHANVPSVIDALLNAIKKHKPDDLEKAQAELQEDNETVAFNNEKARAHAQRTHAINAWLYYGKEAVLDSLAGVGVYGLIRAFRKVKIH